MATDQMTNETYPMSSLKMSAMPKTQSDENIVFSKEKRLDRYRLPDVTVAHQLLAQNPEKVTDMISPISVAENILDEYYYSITLIS